MKKILFGSLSQFRLEHCVTNSSFVVPVNRAVTRRQLCVMSEKISGNLMIYLTSLRALVSRADKR